MELRLASGECNSNRNCRTRPRSHDDHAVGFLDSAVTVTELTFTAVVAPQSGSNVATGTVTFLDGSASLGTGQLNASGGAT